MDFELIRFCVISGCLCILLAGLSYMHGWNKGHRAGYQYGRDSQWFDEFFARIDADKKRRDAQGKFKAKEDAK